MNFETLEKVIELVRKHGIHQVEVEDGGVKIRVTATSPGGVVASMPQHLYPGAMSGMPAMGGMHHAAPYSPVSVTPSMHGDAHAHATAPSSPAKAGASAGIKGRLLKSPFVGTFYRSASPGSDPFTDIGRRVKKGDTLCIVEAMKLMNEIEAEFDGVIKEILVDNEQPVEFDQPLFVIE